MRFQFTVEDADAARLREAYARAADHELVQERIRLNLGPMPVAPSRDHVWRYLALALTTSQQRSAPGSRVWDLWCANPCPLGLERVSAWQPAIAARAAEFLRGWGGVRHYNRIGEFLEANFNAYFRDEEGNALDRLVHGLWELRRSPPTWDDEICREERRLCSGVLALGLKGIGNKQCRNWLQNGRLLRYELPLDSRVLKFLKPMMPGVPLEQDLLGYASYYHFVEDAVQALCKKAGLMPCVADAVMFLTADSAVGVPR